MNADLKRFLTAQEANYNTALSEIRSGRKQSHWMWYIFPQLKGLGNSSTADFYGILSLREATEFLQHPVLGKSLVKISKAVQAIDGKNANEIFGSPDDLKLWSSMTLFSLVEDTNPIFAQVISKYFDGKLDPKTLELLKQ